MEQASGPEAIRKIFELALESREICTVLAGRPLVEYAGEEFAADFIRRRQAAGIFVKSLRNKGTPEKTKDKEIRITGKPLKESIVIWDNGAAIVDSKLSCVIIYNPEVVKVMKDWFEKAWD